MRCLNILRIKILRYGLLAKVLYYLVITIHDVTSDSYNLMRPKERVIHLERRLFDQQIEQRLIFASKSEVLTITPSKRESLLLEMMCNDGTLLMYY